MMNRQDFTNLARRIFRPQTGMGTPRAMYPAREWTIGLLVAVIIIVGSALWSAQTYLKYQDASVTEVGVEVETVVYRKSLVEDALKEFDQRKMDLDLLLQNHKPVVQEEISINETTTTPEDEDLNSTDGNETASSSEPQGTPVDTPTTSTPSVVSSSEEGGTEKVPTDTTPDLAN